MTKSGIYTLTVAFTAAFLALTGDITVTWSSPMLVKLNSTDPAVNPIGKPISESQASLIGSILNIGAMIGPFPFGYLARKYGRKIALLSIAIPHMIGYGIASVAANVYIFYLSRLISGIGIGAGYAVIPIYISEIAEDSSRGSLTMVLSVFWCFGDLIPLVLGPYISYFWFNIILTCLPIIFVPLFSMIAPESPYYLVATDRLTEAEESLKSLRSNQIDVREEIVEIKNCVNNQSQGTFLDIFRSKCATKGLLISVALIIGQQLSGCNAILAYAQEIFIKAGGGLSAAISSAIVGFISFLTSFICPAIADRFDRRLLLMVSAFGCCVSHFVFGVYFYLHDNTSVSANTISWIPIVAIVAYILSINIALGPLPWTVASELLPPHVKSVGNATVSFVCSLMAFLVTNYFGAVEKGIGAAGTIWLFSGVSFVICLFIYFVVPETRGRSFNEIQRDLIGFDHEVLDEDR